jgi:hypothetical protein
MKRGSYDGLSEAGAAFDFYFLSFFKPFACAQAGLLGALLKASGGGSSEAELLKQLQALQAAGGQPAAQVRAVLPPALQPLLFQPAHDAAVLKQHCTEL